MINPSPKQKRMVKAKIKGKTHAQIAQVEYPNATPESGVVLVSTNLNKEAVAQYHDKELAKTLEDNHITKSQYFMNIGLAMTADKQDIHTGLLQPDIQSRLAGNKAAERFLKFDNEQKEQLMNLPGNVDTIELAKVIFKDK